MTLVLTLQGAVRLPPDAPSLPGSARILTCRLSAARSALTLTSAAREFTLYPLTGRLQAPQGPYLDAMHPATRAARETAHGPFPVTPEPLPDLIWPVTGAVLPSLPTWATWQARLTDGRTASFVLPHFTLSPARYARLLCHTEPAFLHAATHSATHPPGGASKSAPRHSQYFNIPFTDVLFHAARLGYPRPNALAQRAADAHGEGVMAHNPLLTNPDAVLTPAAYRFLYGSFLDSTAVEHARPAQSIARRKALDAAADNAQPRPSGMGGKGRGRPKGSRNVMTADKRYKATNDLFPVMADNPLRHVANTSGYAFDPVDPTAGFTRFTPLHPGPYLHQDVDPYPFLFASPPLPRLPLTAINFMQPDMLNWRTLLHRFSCNPRSVRDAHFAQWPMTLHLDPVHIPPESDSNPLPGWAIATLHIPLPTDVVLDTCDKGLPLESLYTTLPEHCLPWLFAIDRRPAFLHYAYPSPEEIQRHIDHIHDPDRPDYNPADARAETRGAILDARTCRHLGHAGQLSDADIYAPLCGGQSQTFTL